MRAIPIAVWALLVLFLAAGPAPGQRAPEPASGLAAFAQRLGLEDIAGFVESVEGVRATRHLPPRYVTKDEARARGWHGGGLCAVLPGKLIGGDVFNNLRRELPAAPGRLYREADLDASCRSRGPKRLVFSNDGLIFITVDHYNSFVPVP